MAVEEARRLPARLVVYRESLKPVFYDVSGIDATYLRRRGERGPLTPIFTKISTTYNPGRGADATVDLDLIVRAVSKIRGPVLYHDQFAGLTGLLRKSFRGQRYALYLHETALGQTPGVMNTSSRLLNFASRSFDHAVLKGAELVLTNSEMNRATLAESGVDSRVLYPGLVPEEHLAWPRERMVLGTAVWEPSRQMDFYARVAELLRAKVVLAGTWARDSEMKAFCGRYRDRVVVTGPISEAQLGDISRRASVYLRFGFGERGPGQGGIQALGFGLPVITNRSLAMAELIQDGVDGYVVDSPEEAAERVNSLMDNPALLQRMMNAAWAKSKTLTWDAHAAKLRAIMDSTFA